MDRYLSLRMFLQESLHNFNNPNKTGFAILHAIIAVELALKERLYLINPHLIYEDIDLNGKKTVMLSKLPKRLKNLGVTLDEKDCKLISDMADWRNDLVHNIPSHNPKLAKKEIGKLYDFLFSFLSKELSKEVTDIMDASEISGMQNIIKEAETLINKSKKSASDNNGHSHPYPCNECHEQDIVGERNNTIFCFLCNESKQEQYCKGCEKPLYFYSSLNLEDCVCNECIERAGDEYISSLIDSSRGK